MEIRVIKRVAKAKPWEAEHTPTMELVDYDLLLKSIDWQKL